MTTESKKKEQKSAELTLQQKNEVVARYAGNESFDDDRYGKLWKDPTGRPGSVFNPRYDSSWDWQIPVWAKCIVDFQQLNRGLNECFELRCRYHHYSDTNNPAAAFDVLVEAIQELNKLKEG